MAIRLKFRIQETSMCISGDKNLESSLSLSIERDKASVKGDGILRN